MAKRTLSRSLDMLPVILGSQNAAMAWLQDDDKEPQDELMQPAAWPVDWQMSTTCWEIGRRLIESAENFQKNAMKDC